MVDRSKSDSVLKRKRKLELTRDNIRNLLNKKPLEKDFKLFVRKSSDQRDFRIRIPSPKVLNIGNFRFYDKNKEIKKKLEQNFEKNTNYVPYFIEKKDLVPHPLSGKNSPKLGCLSTKNDNYTKKKFTNLSIKKVKENPSFELTGWDKFEV